MTKPHSPMNGLVHWLLTCSRMALRNELQKQWFWPLGRWSYFLDDDCSRRASLGWHEGFWILPWWPSQLGWEVGSSRNNGEYCPELLSSYCRCCHRKENQGQAVMMPLGNNEDQPDPCGSVQHQEWMWGLEEDAFKAKLRNYKMNNHGTEQRNAHPQHLGRSKRWHKRQGAHNYQETLPVDPPLQEEAVQIGEVNRVPINQPWLEGLGRAAEQEEPEEVWGWRSTY